MRPPEGRPSGHGILGPVGTEGPVCEMWGDPRPQKECSFWVSWDRAAPQSPILQPLAQAGAAPAWSLCSTLSLLGGSRDRESPGNRATATCQTSHTRVNRRVCPTHGAEDVGPLLEPAGRVTTGHRRPLALSLCSVSPCRPFSGSTLAFASLPVFLSQSVCLSSTHPPPLLSVRLLLPLRESLTGVFRGGCPLRCSQRPLRGMVWGLGSVGRPGGAPGGLMTSDSTLQGASRGWGS